MPDLSSSEHDAVSGMARQAIKDVIDNYGEEIKQDTIKFHDRVFNYTLEAVDNDSGWSYLEADKISAVCGEIEDEVIRGDMTSGKEA